MRKRVFCYLLTALVIVFFTTIASAHGEEESSPIFGNLEILLLALTLSLGGFLLTMKKYSQKMIVFSTYTFSFALYTGSVHVLLGLKSGILLIGGFGVLGILAAPIFFSLNERMRRGARTSLAVVSIFMFIAYFVSNHDIHSLLEDYLGITTKISEIGVVISLFNSGKKTHPEDE